MGAWFHKFQFINFYPHWQGFDYRSWKQAKYNIGTLLDYSIVIGFFEIRVWNKGTRPYNVKETYK